MNVLKAIAWAALACLCALWCPGAFDWRKYGVQR